jgi:Domain of unknown function (DUF4395)
MKIDPSSARFGAAITTVILAVVIITGSGWLLLAQTVVFAIGALAGLRYAPYGFLYKAVLRPRLGPPAELEDEAPPRFAQGVGLVMAAAGTIGYLAVSPAVGAVFAALALVAAFLNATFNLCLGCHLYLLIQRFRPAG